MISRISLTAIFVLVVLTLSISTAFGITIFPDKKPETIMTPPSDAEMQRMIDQRVEKHACMQKAKEKESQARGSQYSFLESYPTANMYDYDVLFYKINIYIDIDAGSLDGYVEMTASSLVEGLSYVDLTFTPDLTITDIKLDGVSQTFSHTTEILTINFTQTFDAGEEFTLKIDYNGISPESWNGGMYFDDYNGQPIVFTSTEPFGSRFWFPCKDFTFDKPDSVDLIYRYPSYNGSAIYDCISNCTLLSKTSDGTTTTSHWFEKYPITTYLIAFSLSDFDHVLQQWEYEPGQFMPVDHNYFPSTPPENPSYSTYYMVHYTIPALNAISYYFGLYPFVDEKYGHMHWDAGGAMEHQTSTSIGPNFNTEYVIAHELGHQWCGDQVTCATFNHIWLNEGFASYIEVLYFEFNYGWATAKNWLMGQRHIDAGTPYVEDIETQQIFDGVTVYDKGSWLVHMLRRQMGDDKFFPAMQYYLFDSEFAGGAATTEDLSSVMSMFYGSDMSWFFNAWVYQNGQPDYKYSFISEEDTANGGYLVSLYLAQENMDGVFPMNVPIVAHSSGYDSSFTVWNGSAGDLYQFNMPGPAVYIQIDPDDDILKTVEQVGFTMHIVANNLPDAELDSQYSFTFTAVGGVPDYSWQIVAGQLPDGLSLDQVTGEISGTPTQIGDYTFTILCADSDSPPATEQREYTITVVEEIFVRGDTDGSGEIDIDDVVYLIDYIFGGGPAPDPLWTGDADCSTGIDIDDVVYLIEYIFGGGPAPCE